MSRSIFVVVACVLLVFGEVSGKNVNLARSKRNPNGLNGSCDSVRPFFRQRNVEEPRQRDTQKGEVCNGECCDANTESLLRKQGQRDFAAQLRHNSRSLQGLLISTSDTVQNHVLDLASQSENKTLVLFSTIYQGMARLSREPITALYKDIRDYVIANESKSGTNAGLDASVHRFFGDLFPLAYHHSANAPKRDFTIEYKACLKKSMDYVLPFGDIPKQISMALSKSLEATRLLLQAFKIGSSVLNTTDSLLTEENSSPECYDALLRMSFCPKCHGIAKNPKPCRGLCQNVLRGCLAKYVAELDIPWSGYVEGIESLVNAMRKNNNDAGINVDMVIRNLENQISTAIMHFMERTAEIDKKVQSRCWPVEFSNTEDPLRAEITTPAPTQNTNKLSRLPSTQFSPLPEQELTHFLSSIDKTKSFYGNLADSLCEDSSFAETKDTNCWNGEKISDYTKVVADVGLNTQRYNPEVKPSSSAYSVDPRVAELADKLRHVHKSAVASLGSYADDYMQQDGIDGSGQGSGQNPDFEDDDEDLGNNGSGSGHHPITEIEEKEEKVTQVMDVPRIVTASSDVARSSTAVLLFVLAVYATLN
ncbi:division abnormally delayed protein [Aethina tumida]|uniref:division abnormally delayed protein n=1 Tax=Aethina tumida TaxID=116153 RepID=UPI00214766DD|nr:division abnormally delayed protein [Aethina tumida]